MKKKDEQGINLFFDNDGDCTAEYTEIDHDTCWGIKCSSLEIQNLQNSKSDEINSRYYCGKADEFIVKILKNTGKCPVGKWYTKTDGKVLYVIKGVTDDQAK